MLSFRYTQNKGAEPDCINHLLKKYPLFILYEQVESVPSQELRPLTATCAGDTQAQLSFSASLPPLAHLLYRCSHDLG